MSNIVDIVRREIAKTLNSVSQAARRGTLGTGASSDYTSQVQGMDGETWEGVEIWQQYGLASRPPTGGEVALLEVDGDGAGAVVVATQDRAHRPSCDAGEVAVYGASGTGQPTVRLKSTGQLVAQSGGATPGSVDLTATGSVDLTPGAAGFVNVGGPTAVDFLIKGTTFNTAHSIMLGLVAAAFTAGAGGFSAIGAAFTALGGEGALSPATQTLCNTAATGCGTAAGACTAAAVGITVVFLPLAATWTSAKGKVL